MSDVPSAGWREVYRWCEVSTPMTAHGEPPVGARAESGREATMESENATERKAQTHEYAKRQLRNVASELEAAQDAEAIEELVEEIEKAGAELAHVKTELEKVSA